MTPPEAVTSLSRIADLEKKHGAADSILGLSDAQTPQSSRRIFLRVEQNRGETCYSS